jgi:hypothetical protein
MAHVDCSGAAPRSRPGPPDLLRKPGGGRRCVDLARRVRHLRNVSTFSVFRELRTNPAQGVKRTVLPQRQNPIRRTAVDG